MAGSSRSGTALDAVDEPEARRLLASCLAAPGWVEGMLAGRPYGSRAATLNAPATPAASVSSHLDRRRERAAQLLQRRLPRAER